MDWALVYGMALALCIGVLVGLVVGTWANVRDREQAEAWYRAQIDEARSSAIWALQEVARPARRDLPLYDWADER